MMTDFLGTAYPRLAEQLRRTSIATLPTPLSQREIDFSGNKQTILIKHDDQTNPTYGGNKIRKLEYIFHRARERGAKRVATFGAVGSNHALATAIFAQEFDLPCTCFLAHQKRTPTTSRTLDMHLHLGTELVRYGGAVDRLALFRHYLQNRGCWVIPLGGSSWLGAVGFVNAGLELAAQIEAGEIELPERIYIANGTMGSVAGLAVGLALARLPTKIHAIRVASNRFAKREVLDRLMLKTLSLLNRYDAAIDVDAINRTHVVWRDEFYAGGYAAVDTATQQAVKFAADKLDLSLDTTYTGKAMAALLHDLKSTAANSPVLFWNTYNSRPLADIDIQPELRKNLPDEFVRYYD